MPYGPNELHDELIQIKRNLSWEIDETCLRGLLGAPLDRRRVL